MVCSLLAGIHLVAGDDVGAALVPNAPKAYQSQQHLLHKATLLLHEGVVFSFGKFLNQ